MRLIVGLGNVGVNFEGTRHNFGFDILNHFAAASSIVWQVKDKFKSVVAEATLDGQKVLLAKPLTYYNLSGDAVRALKDFYKLENSDILVVHDELALPFGTIRTRSAGSDAGNNGVKSIVASLGQDVPRLRLGIANERSANQDAADFVLGQFTGYEREQLPQVKSESMRLVNTFIQQGRLPNTSWHVS